MKSAGFGLRTLAASCVLGAVGLSAGGCSPGARDDCGGAAPTLDDCEFADLFWADCGGTGDPSFACWSAGCRWFATGCVPRGYLRTDCPPSDACCHATATGPWLYSDGAESYEPTSVGLIREDVAAIGSAIVTRTSGLSLTVTVEPDVQVLTPSQVWCDVDLAAHDFCTATGFSLRRGAHGMLALRVVDGSRFDVEALYIELVQLDDGSWHARTFVRQEQEMPASRRDCRLTTSRPLEVTGNVVVTTLDFSQPEQVHGRADLSVEGVPARVYF